MAEKKEPPVLRKPPWLRVRVGQGPQFAGVRAQVHGQGLHTVCEEALCPNIGTCWKHGHATIMILGDTCTRACRFCAVKTGRSGACDEDEPRRVAEAIRAIGLVNVVITSVTRDDLPDGGARIWAETIRSIRGASPKALIEVLVPDFGGSEESLRIVAEAQPDVFGHNLETVPLLYPQVRPAANYLRSLELLKRVHDRGLIAKTGIMVGVGETREQVFELMNDALAAGVEILYIGQYLQPTRRHLAVHRYVEPSEFEAYREKGLALGFPVVVSGPLVRSSYHSDEQDAHVRRRLGRKQGA
jgi:lipoyl synthase